MTGPRRSDEVAFAAGGDEVLGQGAPSSGTLGGGGPDYRNADRTVALPELSVTGDGAQALMSGGRWSGLGRLDKQAVGRAALRALGQALRDGTPCVERLAAHAGPLTTAADPARGTAPDGRVRDEKHRGVEEQLREAGLAWATETDPWRRQQLNSKIDQLRAELAALAAPPSAVLEARRPESTEHTITVDGVERVLGALLAGGSVERDVAEAADTVLHDLRVDVDATGRAAQFSCYLRLPTVGGTVLEAGPIYWTVALMPTKGAQAARSRLLRTSTSPMPASTARHLLEQAGCGVAAATAAASAPFTWLVPILLHELAGTPLPVDTPDQWRADGFRAWLRQVYVSRTFAYPGRGKYTRLKHAEQAVVLALHAAGGTATTLELLERLPVKLAVDVRNTASTQTVDARDGTRSTAPLITPIGRLGRGAASMTRRWVNLSCHCGEPALHVAVAPEIPRALLCGAGHMIDAKAWGVGADVAFPKEYLALAPTWEDCIAWLTKPYDLRDNPPLGATAAAILRLDGMRVPASMSTREVAVAIGKAHATTRESLRHLAIRGRVARLGEHLTRTWQLIDDPTLPPVRLRADATP